MKDLGGGDWKEEGLEGERLAVPQVQVADHNQELLHHNTVAEVEDLQTKQAVGSAFFLRILTLCCSVLSPHIL